MGKQGERMQAQVLEALQGAAGPCSAYDILDALRPNNAKLAPTTVYRALTALTEQGRVHRLESLNAYIVCQCDDHAQDSILSICGDCGSVEETIAPELLANLARTIGSSGFAPTRHVVEVHGTCADCGPERTAS